MLQPKDTDWLNGYKNIISVAQSCPTLCEPMNCSTPGLPVLHQLSESIQIGDAIQPSHPLSSVSPVHRYLQLLCLPLGLVP